MTHLQQVEQFAKQGKDLYETLENWQPAYEYLAHQPVKNLRECQQYLKAIGSDSAVVLRGCISDLIQFRTDPEGWKEKMNKELPEM